MLHAPTSESKQQAEPGGTSFVPEPQLELHPRLGASAGAYAMPFGSAGTPSDSTQRAQRFAGLQKTVGNQAVLRMLSNSDRPGHISASSGGNPVLERKCGCASTTENHADVPSSTQLQEKLTINTPGDAYEQEADRVVEALMRMPNPVRAETPVGQIASAPSLQRKCACGGSDTECAACNEKREGILQRAAAEPSFVNAAPPIVHEVLHSHGQPLDAATRAFFEPRFGYDFSGVRIHTDGKAAESAVAVNAVAYTVGQDIVFADGRHAPATVAGKQLFAHELTHVVQQTSGVDPQLSSHCSTGRPAWLQRVHVDPITGRKFFDCPDYAGDTKLEACLNDEDRLSPSERGPTVVKVQNGLLKDGEDLGKDGADGVYGPATGQAVMAFKRKYHLGFEQFPDVGPGTMTKLDELCTAPACTLVCGPDQILDTVNCVCNPASPTPPQNCADLLGSCDFYLCRERNTPCGDTGYYKGFGHKYCKRFSQVTRPKMSRVGQDWIDCTLRCLQQHIVDNVAENTACDEVRTSAFNSHPLCYVDCGVCFLPPNDMARIQNAIDPEDLDLSQVLETGLRCLTPPAPPPDAAFQLGCVMRLGGCPQTRGGGLPSVEDIGAANDQCRKETGYSGDNVTPTDEDCERAFGGGRD